MSSPRFSAYISTYGTVVILYSDISGFTSFVTSTERIHSGHLISELLEIVIAENSLGMEVQEVEGDAVFFLRSGEAPGVDEILEQAKRMFLAFHAHLRVIERDKVCQCGACRTASDLTLKFAVHYGEVERTLIAEVPQLEQPHDVSHRRPLKTLDMHIAAPLLPVHALLTDPQSKKKYTPDLKESVTPTPINRVNSTHTCVFEDFEVHFVTRQQTVRENDITYKEAATVSVGFSFVADYRLRERDGGTDVLLKVFPSVLAQGKGVSGAVRVFRWLKSQLLLRAALRGSQKNLQRFKLYCERVAEKEEE